MSESAPAGPPANCPVVNDFDPVEHWNFEFFKKARAETPVFFHEASNAYWLTRYADCDRVLGDRGKQISAAPALRPNVVPMAEAMQVMGESGLVLHPSVVDEDGDEHKLHRTVSQPPFTRRNIEELAEFIRGQVVERLEALPEQGEADIVDAMVYEVPGTVILHMMGVPNEQLGMVKGFRGPWAEFLWGFPGEDVQMATAHAMGEFGKWARSVASDRIENRGDDIISVAISNLEQKGALDSSRLWLDSYTLNVVMAGHETTANSAAAGIVALMRARDQWEALCADPSLIPNAVDELLRFDTGVPTWRQEAIDEVEISGVKIPAGSLIYACINSANRDEQIFEDGEILDVRRSNANKHISFGKGAHTCMGNHLAKLEIQIMLEELTSRFPDMELVEGQQFSFSPNTSQRGPEQVQISWGAGVGAAV